MCGIVVATGLDAKHLVETMCSRLSHRGPDAQGVWRSDALTMGHRRLSIIDLSDAGSQPMLSSDGRYVIVFNGEVYNYKELRAELHGYPFHSNSDTEVVIAAWAKWGEASLDRLVGMFAFALWDTQEKALVVVRDRFGVKPLVYATLPDGNLVLASEIKALHAAGIRAEPDQTAWATYLAYGTSDHPSRTFWSGISALPAGSLLRWSPGATPTIRRWYDLSAHVGGELDQRDRNVVAEEYLELLRDSVRLRFRADVPVGINLSGGLDSSILFGLVQAVRGSDSDIKAFSFITNDERYDELPWVRLMLEGSQHPLVPCLLRASDVPQLAKKISEAVDEPFGGIPTLAYATLFQRAREEGVIVLLDGQGLDEQWGGYDYYRPSSTPAAIVQGGGDPAVRPECLVPDLVTLATKDSFSTPFNSRLRDLQYRDLTATKIPRALRYNDRVSMAASTELREPFLDHRLIELALRQPDDRKIADGVGKVLLRQLAKNIVPETLRTAPKRPVQTPQREWLRGELASWANDLIETAIQTGWFNPAAKQAWQEYRSGRGDNSHWVWQWLSVGMLVSSQRKFE